MPLLTPKLLRFLKLSLALPLLAGPAKSVFGQATLGELATRAAKMKPMPGDRVIMHVYGNAALSDMSTLDEKGRIVLPQIGMIQADAYSISDLRDTIRARMTAVLSSPVIEVAVLRRIIVSGEVIKPGVYFADLTSSFGEMVAQTGGLRETGHPKKVYLVRGATRTKIDNWQSDQSPTADLQSGDLIIVGRKSWMELNIIPFASLSMAAVSLTVSLVNQLKN